MILVVADAGPIRYLVVIDQIDLLRQLFGKVCLPSIVAGELLHPSAPPAVRNWINEHPDWVEIWPAEDSDDAEFNGLDSGERSALALGLSLKASLILIDERKAAFAALRKGFEVTGTLGVLDLAAEKGLVNLGYAFDQLKLTNFRYRQALMDNLLEKHAKPGQ